MRTLVSQGFSNDFATLIRNRRNQGDALDSCVSLRPLDPSISDMAKQQKRNTKAPVVASPFEEARDELFQHIMRCGVVGSEPEHALEWFNDTMTYMKDRYPELAAEQLDELRKLGERFAQPPKKRDDTAAA